MAICKVCGNDYERSFEVVQDGQSFTYDSFECAIHDLAPTCAHCQVRVVGHGVEAGKHIFCCAHCARNHGITAVVDSTRQTPHPQHAPFI